MGNTRRTRKLKQAASRLAFTNLDMMQHREKEYTTKRKSEQNEERVSVLLENIHLKGEDTVYPSAGPDRPTCFGALCAENRPTPE